MLQERAKPNPCNHICNHICNHRCYKRAQGYKSACKMAGSSKVTPPGLPPGKAWGTNQPPCPPAAIDQARSSRLCGERGAERGAVPSACLQGSTSTRKYERSTSALVDGPPPKPSPPVGTTGNGTCGSTSYGGDCNAEPSGAWDAAKEGITSLEACVARATGCKMANFVSYSNVPGNSDCSWYSNCDFDHLCENCATCGIGCPKYFPYTSEVVRNATARAASAPATRRQTRRRARHSARHAAAAPAAGEGRGVGGDADYADSLALLPSDEELTLRVFVDRTVLEAYWMDGRVAMTAAIVPGYAREGTAQLEVFADTDMEMRSAVAWGMESIWVSPEEVRRAAAMR